MTETQHAACQHCGTPGVIVAFRTAGQLQYLGTCPSCGREAVTSTNYDRAVDFWDAWQAPADTPVPAPTEEAFTDYLTPEPEVPQGYDADAAPEEA